MTDRTPDVSVLMAVYNGAKYVRLAIDSVLTQDFASLELVIVDDTSTDETPAIIHSYGDPRIVYIRNATNLGQTPSLNVALSHARAPFVSRIDADDVFLPGKIRRQFEFMTGRPDVAVCGTWAMKIDEHGDNIGLNQFPVHPLDVRFRTLRTVPVCHVSIMARTAAMKSQAGYGESYRYAADFALWSDMLRDSLVITNIPEVLTQYREFSQSLGALNTIGGEAGNERARIIQRNARELAQTELSLDDSRSIALFYFPTAGLDPADLRNAYAKLRRLATAVYGRVPLKRIMELMAILSWGLMKGYAARRGRPAGGQAARPKGSLSNTLRYPETMVLSAGAWLGSVLGLERVVRLKNALGPRVLKHLK